MSDRGPSDNGFYAGDIDDLEDEDLEELEPYEEILEEWMDLGWFGLLPVGVITITTAFEDLTTPRLDFDAATAEAAAGGGLELLDNDPLWPVLSREQAVADGIVEDDGYSDYLAGVLDQREHWIQLCSRQPAYAISTLSELVDLLIGWGLLREQHGVLELVEPVPDPLDLLPLSEETIASVILDRMGPAIEAVEDVLHDVLYHSDQDEFATTLDRLAQQAEVTAEIARLAIAMLISHPDSGLTADRFGPLDSEGLENLKAHQKFSLRIDRAAPGFSEHEH